MELLNELADLDIAPAAMAKVQALFEQQQIKLAEKDFKITALTHELAYYKRVRFGKASEALVGEQRLLFDETVDMDLAAIDEELEAQAPVKRQRKRAGRQPLPTHLERIEHRYEPESCQCGQCGADLVKIGEDVSEQLDVEPARFFVHRLWPCRAGACPCKGKLLRRRRAMPCEFPATPYPPAVCVPSLRNGDGGADPACCHRRRHGRRWAAGLDRSVQAP